MKTALDVHKAIRMMRGYMDLSNQEYAHRLGISMPALNKYLLDRTPEPQVIVKFYRLAKTVGLPEVENVFLAELCKQLGLRSINELTEPLEPHPPKRAAKPGATIQ